MDAEITAGKAAGLGNLTYLVEVIESQLEIIQKAKQHQACFSRETRKQIEAQETGVDFFALSMQLALLHPDQLDSFEDAARGLLGLVGGLLGNVQDQFDWLTEDDVQAIRAFIKLLRKLGPRSKSQLSQLAGAVMSDQEGYCLVHVSHKASELRFKYRVPDDQREWFQLDTP